MPTQASMSVEGSGTGGMASVAESEIAPVPTGDCVKAILKLAGAGFGDRGVEKNAPEV